jgi:nucleotide-binding universal stress UspA family protein
MALLVPFDGSDLSQTALKRGVEFAEYTGDGVLVLLVIPDDAEYATEQGWTDEGESYDPEAVADRFEDLVTEIAPDAEFRVETPVDVSSMADVTTDVARTIREISQEVDASIVFIGSENAGRVSTPVCSVGAPLSEDPGYDVHIVRHTA